MSDIAVVYLVASIASVAMLVIASRVPRAG